MTCMLGLEASIELNGSWLPSVRHGSCKVYLVQMGDQLLEETSEEAFLTDAAGELVEGQVLADLEGTAEGV